MTTTTRAVRRVVATYLRVVDGRQVPERGTVRFDRGRLTDPAADEVLPEDSITIPLVDGRLDVALLVLDGLQPAGAVYQVTERIGRDVRQYALALTAAATPLDLADAVPAAPGPPMVQYASQASVDNLQDRVVTAEGVVVEKAAVADQALVVAQAVAGVADAAQAAAAQAVLAVADEAGLREEADQREALLRQEALLDFDVALNLERAQRLDADVTAGTLLGGLAQADQLAAERTRLVEVALAAVEGDVDGLDAGVAALVLDLAEEVLRATTAEQQLTQQAATNLALARQRAGHTGQQPAATISDFDDAVAALLADLVVAGANVAKQIDPVTRTITLSAVVPPGGGTDPEIVRDVIAGALAFGPLLTGVVNDDGDTITVTTTATANRPDAELLARGNHTGTQAQGTIVGLVDALAAKATVAALQAETTARTNALTALTTRIGQEEQTRANADAALQTAVDARATTVQLDTERQARFDADTGLQTQVDARATTVALQGEVQRAVGVEAQLRLDVDSKRTAAQVDQQAAALVQGHEAAVDPHGQYTLQATEGIAVVGTQTAPITDAATARPTCLVAIWWANVQPVNMGVRDVLLRVDQAV